MIDLGLPSGLKWANMNVGATSPEDAGLYFQWGDTIGYTKEQVEAGEKVFNWDTYFDTNDGGSTFNKYASDKLTVLGSEDDAATVNMGSEWRMPTKNEFQELIDNTTLTFIDISGNEYSAKDAFNGTIPDITVKGLKFTGSNGNSIFMCLTGEYRLSEFRDGDIRCYLWSSNSSNYQNSESQCFYYYYEYEMCDAGISVGEASRNYGLPVRGVQA